MVYVFLADGFETVEALTPVDILRRGGIEVATVSITDSKNVVTSHRVPVAADITIDEVNWEASDALVLPGGMPGTKNLAACKKLMDRVCDFAKAGRLIAAICAGPALTFGDFGLLKGKKATCYPGMEDHLKGAEFVKEEVVVDGNIITSRGMGTAIAFSLAILEKLAGKNKADEIAKAVVYRQ